VAGVIAEKLGRGRTRDTGPGRDKLLWRVWQRRPWAQPTQCVCPARRECRQGACAGTARAAMHRTCVVQEACPQRGRGAARLPLCACVRTASRVCVCACRSFGSCCRRAWPKNEGRCQRDTTARALKPQTIRTCNSCSGSKCTLTLCLSHLIRQLCRCDGAPLAPHAKSHVHFHQSAHPHHP
jgi:hypothetical protein